MPSRPNSLRLVAASAAVVGACASQVVPGTESMVVPSTTRVSQGALTGSAEVTNNPRAGAYHVPAPIDAVWSVLGAVFDSLEIPVGGADPIGHIMGNQGYRASHIENRPLSNFLDCGRGMGPPYADQYSVTLLVITRLTRGDGTIVATTVDATAKPRATRGDTIQCSSKGTLERRITELVFEALGAGPGER